MLVKSKRIEYIDSAKAIGIGLVVLGHLTLPEALHNWIYAFHMPLFFILSGLTFRTEPFSKFLKKRAFSILLPYVLFSLLMLAKDIVKILIGSNPSAILRVVKIRIPAIFIALQNSRYSAGIYWFLPCLFVAELLLYALVKRFKDNKSAVFGVAAAVGISGAALDHFFDYSLPFCLDVALFSLVFLAFGYAAKEKLNGFIQQPSKPKRLCACTVLLAIGTGGAALNARVSKSSLELSVGEYANIALTLIGAFGLSLAVMLISGFLRGKVFSYIGKNTLFIYMLHPFLLHDSVFNVAYKTAIKLVHSPLIGYIVATAVIWAAIMFICVCASFLYNPVMKKLKKLLFKEEKDD